MLISFFFLRKWMQDIIQKKKSKRSLAILSFFQLKTSWLLLSLSCININNFKVFSMAWIDDWSLHNLETCANFTFYDIYLPIYLSIHLD